MAKSTKAPFISICILAYNRPETLRRLLSTIDTVDRDQVEVIVCEDCSPRQREVREVTKEFAAQRLMQVRYYENECNLGYDVTFCRLIEKARGDWLVFMGDDDEFVPEAFNKMAEFIRENSELGYVMKSHYLIHDGGKKEVFRYFNRTVFFDAGLETYLKLFRRSVFIAGFTIKREYASQFATLRFNGTMLTQLYILAEVVLRTRSAYFDLPFTQQYASHKHNEKDVMYNRQKKEFVPRKPTLDMSIEFLKGFASITSYIDEKYSVKTTEKVRKDMSKYFYPSLAIHRDSGIVTFLRYIHELDRLGFNTSVYYYIYIIGLLLLGRSACDKLVRALKSVLGYTPQL